LDALERRAWAVMEERKKGQFTDLDAAIDAAIKEREKAAAPFDKQIEVRQKKVNALYAEIKQLEAERGADPAYRKASELVEKARTERSKAGDQWRREAGEAVALVVDEFILKRDIQLDKFVERVEQVLPK
jgi:hypothetical protein